VDKLIRGEFVMKYLKIVEIFIGVLIISGTLGINGFKQAEVVDPGKKAVSKKQEIKKEPLAQKKSAIKVTFIELGSVNCIPCRMMQPIMEDIKKEYKEQVEVVFYDVWTEAGRPLGEKYKIRAIPTQVFLDKNGTEYFRHVGFFPKEELVKVLKQQGVK
jgi:thioredoxin 1